MLRMILTLYLSVPLVTPVGPVGPPVEVEAILDETAFIQELKENRPAPQVVLAPQRVTQPVIRYEVEQWRPLVEKYFLPADVPWAMRVMQCESGGNPNAKNPNSTASGLFQQLASYWPDRSQWYGWAGYSVFDPEANIAVSAGRYYDGGPGHWVCK